MARGTPAAPARTTVDVNPVCVSVSMNLNRSFAQPWTLVTPSTRVAVTPRSAACGTSGSGADHLAAMPRRIGYAYKEGVRFSLDRATPDKLPKGRARVVL